MDVGVSHRALLQITALGGFLQGYFFFLIFKLLHGKWTFWEQLMLCLSVDAVCIGSRKYHHQQDTNKYIIPEETALMTSLYIHILPLNLCQPPIYLPFSSVSFRMSCKDTCGPWPERWLTSNRHVPYVLPRRRTETMTSAEKCKHSWTICSSLYCQFSEASCLHITCVSAGTWQIRRSHVSPWRVDIWSCCYNSSPRDMLKFKH